MKKNTSPPQNIPVSTSKPVEWSVFDTTKVCLFSLLLFFAMTVQTFQMSLLLGALALVLSIGKTPLANLRAHISLPLAGLVVFILVNTVMALSSRFGSTAASELYKLLAAFSLVVILLVQFEKKHTRGLLWGFAAVCAAIALICIDTVSAQGLFSAFNALMNTFGCDYSSILRETARINGIYNNANLTGALLGPAILVCVYLAHSSGILWQRFAALWLAGISMVSFFLTVSRGAILFWVLSLLVYLVSEGKETRVSLFFLLLSAVLPGACGGIFAMFTMEEGAPAPLLTALVCGLVCFAADWAVGSRLTKVFQSRKKLLLLLSVGLVTVACCGIVAVFQYTQPFVFNNGPLRRGLALDPGTYTLSIDMENGSAPLVQIVGQTDQGILTGETVLLYEDYLEEPSFTVPEDVIWVNFAFFSVQPDLQINRAVLSDGTQIPLTYTYIPESIVVRLQDGLLLGGNFQQRLQYIRDGFTLFKQSPLLGHGLGCTEHLLLSVQPYHYESLYLHNHLMQVLTETGVVGLAAFLLLLLGSLASLLSHRFRQADSLTAVLIACWVMINGHSLMEINFSVRMFQCAAFFLLLLPVLYCPPLFSLPRLKQVGYGALALVWLAVACPTYLLYSHHSIQRQADDFSTGDAVEFMETMKDFARRAPFDREQYQLNFVGNAFLFDNPEYERLALEYVAQLRESGTYTACSALARYYYLPTGDFQELFACSRQGIAQVASDPDPWNLQVNFYRSEVLPACGTQYMEQFLQGTVALSDYLEQYNAGQMLPVTLSEENQTFLDMVAHVVEADLPADAAYLYLTAPQQSAAP